MSEQPGRGAAGAGYMLLATVALCTGVGLGIGALAGEPALIGIAGVFVGFAAGLRLVYGRFKDL
jgi:hypothetical protein